MLDTGETMCADGHDKQDVAPTTGEYVPEPQGVHVDSFVCTYPDMQRQSDTLRPPLDGPLIVCNGQSEQRVEPEY